MDWVKFPIKLLDHRIARADNQLLFLFLLNKIPGKPEKCLKCGQIVDKEHLILCNRELWLEEIKKLGKNMEIKEYTEKNNNKYEDKDLAYYMLKLAQQISKRTAPKIITSLVFLLRNSYQNCSTGRNSKLSL